MASTALRASSRLSTPASAAAFLRRTSLSAFFRARKIASSAPRAGGGGYGISYRGLDPNNLKHPEMMFPPKSNHTLATAVMALTWWWMLFHFFSEPGHVLGEFLVPDPKEWTDEELGIPPDDVE